ncbi:MAG TPA: hypothetical protein VH437_12815 [Terriglobales bacterium]|jgi:hypothetical protein
MEILNVGAGQTNEEQKVADEHRRTDLRADSRNDANFFFLAAGLAALGTGLLPIRLNFLVNIGLIDLLLFYGRPLGQLHAIVLYIVAGLWLVVLLGLGFIGRGGHRWAFLAGIGLYAVDMIALMMMFSIWAFGVHAFFVYRWYQGQSALKEAGTSA